MDSSFFLGIGAVSIGFFSILGTLFLMVYRKSRSNPQNKTVPSSSSSPTSPPPYFPRNYMHHVYPSFHGADVRRSFLGHILKEFRRKGIDIFIDNEIKRELGQIMVPVYYEVDPVDVRKQTGDFGKHFKRTCKGKTYEGIKRWRQALAELAVVAGYHSRNWINEASMIEKIAIDISNMLINSTPSRDFDGLVGMGAHMEMMEQMLRLELDGSENDRNFGSFWDW